MQYIKRTRWLSSVFLCFSILILYTVNILIEGKEDTQQIFSPDPCCYAHPSYILMTRNFLKTQKLLDPSSSQLSGNWFEQEPDKFSPWCQTRSFSILHSNDVSRFPIVSIQVKFHSCPVWSSVIIALCMDGWIWTEAWWNVELSWRKSSPSSTKAGFPAALKYSFMVETPTEFCLKSFQQLNLIQFYSELPVTAWQHAHIHKINFPFSVEYFKQYYS